MTWCPRPDVRAERARRARQQQMTPPPSPQGTAALGPEDVFCSIWAQGGRRPRPHCGPEPPQGRQCRQVRQGRVQGHREQHQGAPAAQCAAHGAQHHDSAHALPAQSTAHSAPQDAAHSAPQDTAHRAPHDAAAHSAPQDAAHSAPQGAGHSAPQAAAHSAPQDAAHSAPHGAARTAPMAAHSAQQSTTHSAQHQRAHTFA